MLCAAVLFSALTQGLPAEARAYPQQISTPHPQVVPLEGEVSEPDIPLQTTAGILPSGVRPFLLRQPVEIGDALVLLNSFFDHRLPVSYENNPALPADLRDANANQTVIFTNSSRTGTGTSCDYGYSCYSHHNGIDYSTAGNIYAPAAGKISYLRDSTQAGATAADVCAVWIKHDLSDPADNTFEYSSMYLHLDRIGTAPEDVRNREGRTCGTSQYWCVDDPIRAGDLIGVAGNDPCGGISGGTHLHFAVAQGLVAEGIGNPRGLDPFGWWSNDNDPWADPRLSNLNYQPQPSYFLWGAPPKPDSVDPDYWGDDVHALVDDSHGAFHLIVPVGHRSALGLIQPDADAGVTPLGERAWRTLSLGPASTSQHATGLWGLYVPYAGTYRIEVHVPHLPDDAPQAADAAVYQVSIPLSNGSLEAWDSVAVDQRQDNEWVALSKDATTNTFALVANSVVLVRLSDRLDEAGQSVIYDAARLVSITPVTPPGTTEARQVGFVMDNSSSMLASGKISAVVAEVPPWIDTLEASGLPYVYSFVQFANNVLPVQVTEDAETIKAAILSLNANDNNYPNYDCPEESLGAILDLAPYARNGDVLLFTDDVPLSAANKGPLALASLILNRERLHSILLPKTCTFDGTNTSGFFTYWVLSTITGGTYQQLATTDLTDEALQIVLSEMDANADVFAARDTAQVGSAEATLQYEVQIDDSMEKVNFLLSRSGSSTADFVVYRPDGSPVSAADPGVSFTDSGSTKYFSVVDPPAGTWVIIVGGSGDFDLRVTGESLLTFTYVGDLRAAPADWVELAAQISGPVDAAQFNILNANGEFIDTALLKDDGTGGDIAAGDGLFIGYYQPSASGDYRLQLEGTTASGVPFSRSDPRLIRIRNVSVTSPEPQVVAPGAALTFTFEIRNAGGNAETYDLAASSGSGWIWYYPPASVTIAGGQSTTADVTVYVPSDASPNLVDNVSLSATLQTDRSVIADGTTAAIVADVDEIHTDYPLYLPALHR